MTDGNSPSLESLLEFAHTLADASGDVILQYFRQHGDIEDKAGSGIFDPVTAADRAAEQVIRDKLEATYPDHGIVCNGESRIDCTLHACCADCSDGSTVA